MSSATLPAHMPVHHAALLRAALAQAAQAGESIMGQVLAAASTSLNARATQARNARDRDEFLLGLQLLNVHAASLGKRYPGALASAWAHTAGEAAGPARTLAAMHFDQLELMDSEQVQGRVALAKAQQVTLLAVDTALAEFNRFMAGLLGLGAVQPERNPLRPEVFLEVLQSLLVQTQAPPSVRAEWLRHMGDPLGQALGVLYKSLSLEFQKNGVVALGSSAVPAPEGSPKTTPDTKDETLLTLERLRGLLLGELDTTPADSATPAFASQFSRQFESEPRDPPTTDFHSTVPAALEALQDMQQVDRMMDRLGQRQDRAADSAGAASGAPESARARLQRSAQGLGQALSLEVVALMVDNIVRDARLLAPVKAMVKSLEPALLSLALVDRRFFSDKQHPARQLLQEMTHRSLAFESAEGAGFKTFWAPVQRAVRPLLGQDMDSAQPFEQALHALLQSCEGNAADGQRQEAVQALQQAEARHVLAEQMGQDIAARPDAGQFDPRVLGFLTGPWAQVMAQARLLDTTGSDDPGHYRELVAALVWSAQPAKTSQNIARLTQLVPKLLGKLREGLALIDYPSVKTSAFFDVLMKLHQQAFRPAVAPAEPPKPAAALAPSLLGDDDPWLAPAEVKVSGFMSLPEETPEPSAQAAVRGVAPAKALPVGRPVPRADPPADADLAVGAWVALWVNEAWVRTQISWASPHGTLFLFTSAHGSTQSMTRRSRDKMWAQGSLRLVSGQPVVDGALDAVLQTAMRNSLSLKL